MSSDLVLRAEKLAATSEDFIEHLTEDFLDSIGAEQDKREFKEREKKYQRELRAKYFKAAKKTLENIWTVCGRRKYGHDYGVNVDAGGYSITTCSYCKHGTSENNGASTRYNESQVQHLADRLFSKDKEAGLILSYAESGGK